MVTATHACAARWLLAACTLAALLPARVLCASPPPEFTMDLDAPAATRWQGAVAAVLKAHSWEYGFGAAFASHNESLFSHLKPQHWRLLGDSVTKHFPEHAAELRSLSVQFTAAGHPVTYEYLCGWVYFHELAHTELQVEAQRVSKECTGLLLQDTDGTVWHSGNMDQSPPAVRNVTLKVTFTKGGQTFMEGVDWYWFTTGVTRVVRKGVATLQENWRTDHLAPVQHSGQVFADIQAGVTPQVLVFRRALTSLNTFPAVLNQMRRGRLAAPYYVVISGPAHGEGYILARNFTDTLHELSLATSKDKWFIAQTNYDHWLPDDALDPRRTAAEHELRAFGRPSPRTAQMLTLSALSSYPVHNPHTAYTALMSAAAGTLDAFVRRALCPATADGGPQDGRYGCPTAPPPLLS